MLDGGDRIARRLDDDVDLRMAHQRRQSSVRCVLLWRRASANEPADVTSGFQPSRARFSRARGGERSAMPRRWMPGVVGICDRYMEPNLPAPIRPMRSGLP